MIYRKKPVEVEAIQFVPERQPWPQGVLEVIDPDEKSHYVITTLEGAMMVTPGDYIITSVKGERYPCKPDIFEMTYELKR